MNTAIIGLGNAGFKIDEDLLRTEIWTHAKAYINHPSTNLLSVCDENHLKLIEFREKYGPLLNFYSDYKRMIEHDAPDIVSICTPTFTHAQIIRDIMRLNNRPKAIFCEKPLTFTYKEGREIVDLCKEKGIHLAVNYMRRWDEKYLKIKELIDNYTYGELRTAVAYTDTALYMNASHMIDLLIMLLGKIDWIGGEFSTEYVRNVCGRKDYGGIFHFKAGDVLGLLSADCDDYTKHRFELDLQFSDGRIRITNDGRDIYCDEYRKSKYILGYYELSEVMDNSWPKTSNRMLDAITNIIETINNGAKLNCSGEDALESIKVINACYQSNETGESVYVL